MSGGPTARATACWCREGDCLHFATGYPLCRPCGEHHRQPECAVDETGRALALCGHPWEDDPCMNASGTEETL